MTADMETSIRASRRRVARSRGALSGILLIILGAWAAIVPFIGPYFDLAYTPRPNDAWQWTAARGWLEVLPGAAAVAGGLLLMMSASRAMTVFGGWLAALAGAWLVIGPPLADAINLDLGQPDPSMGTNTRAATSLLFFFAVGAAILFFGALAIGRVSVLSVRDVRAAERRAALEAEAAEAERRAEAEAAQRRAADAEAERRAEAERSDPALAGRHAEADGTGAPAEAPAYGPGRNGRWEGADGGVRGEPAPPADRPGAGYPNAPQAPAGAPAERAHQPVGGPPPQQPVGGPPPPQQGPGHYPPAPPPRQG